jgi:hypothetical protein
MTGNRAPLLVVVLLLLAANASMAWQIYLETGSSPSEILVAKPVVHLTTMPQLDSIANFEMPPEDRFDSIALRPLFSSSRRPAPGGAGAFMNDSSDPNVILTGIVYSDSKRLVLLRPEAGGEIILLREGQILDGWILAEISREQAIFRYGQREAVLELLSETEPTLLPKQMDNQREEKQQEKKQDQDSG